MSDLNPKTLNPEIEQTPAVLSFNYETFKANLEQRLEKYRTVVTSDTVKQAKETATELNKLKTDLDTQRKEAIKYVSAPIKKADDQMKEYVRLVADGRQEILDQVAKFDQVRLDELREELTGRRDRLREGDGIRSEFFGAAESLDDLVKLGNLTATDRVTNKAAQAVADRVNQELQLQQTVERRLLELENASYRAGLSSPLERAHIEHFLKADEDTYKAKLQQLLDVEVQRQQQAEAKIRQSVERESQSRVAAHGESLEREARLAAQAELDRELDQRAPADDYDAGLFDEPGHGGYLPESQPETKPEPQPSGASEQYTLTVTMTATLPAGMRPEDVEQQFRAFIEGPGNTRVDFITVEREEVAA